MRALSPATADALNPIRLATWDRLAIDIDKELRRFTVHIFSASSIRQPSSAARISFLNRIPEKKKLDGIDCWQIAATDYTAEIIRALWPDGQIEWRSQNAYSVYSSFLLETTLQEQNAEAYALFKATGQLPSFAATVRLHDDHNLRPAPYQHCAIALALRSEGYGYFMEQGTGKTLCCISEICTLAAERPWTDPIRAFIIPPKNVRANWLREFERFATVPGRVNVMRGSKLDRTGLIIEALIPQEGSLFSVVVMSYDAMVRTIDAIHDIMDGLDIQFDLAALDEAHFIKGVETKRAKAAMKLRDISKRRRVLTGTPVCNSPLDLYTLFEFMGDGYSGFKNHANFKAFYGVFDKDGDANEKLIGVQNLPFMQERLSRLSFIIRKKEALPDLPEKVYDIDEVEMTKEQQEAYDNIAEQLVIEIENELDSSQNKMMTINNVLTQLLRLAQVTCGYVTWDEVIDLQTLAVARPKTIEWFATDPKLERLVEIAKEKQPQEKTIIWSCFVPCIKRIHERFTKESIDHVIFYGETSDPDRAEAERRFNFDPACKFFVGNPAAGGVGLNLLGYPPGSNGDCDTNCDHVIYYAQDWSYVKRAQSEDRAHRRGTRTNVRITDLVVPETIDEEIRVRVQKKKMLAMDIGDLREILGNLLQKIGRVAA